MALKNLKLRFNKKNTDCADLSKETSSINKESLDETEVTVPEDDEAKYGYNTYDDEEQQRHSWSAPINRQRMPRRSSMKGSGGPSRRRHSLTFSKDVSVATITPTTELAKKKSLWFGEKEYDKMRDKMFLIADMAKEGKGAKYCTRGLESIIQKDSETHKYAAWDAVMDEQENQMNSGSEYFDDDALSESYRHACEESVEEATRRAKQDERAVAEYLAETRSYCRRMSM